MVWKGFANNVQYCIFALTVCGSNKICHSLVIDLLWLINVVHYNLQFKSLKSKKDVTTRAPASAASLAIVRSSVFGIVVVLAEIRKAEPVRFRLTDLLRASLTKALLDPKTDDV